MLYIFPITTVVNIFLKLTTLIVNIFERKGIFKSLNQII